MPDVIRGVVHGRTIELTTDPGLEDGQEVEVVVRVVKKAEAWGEGIGRSAGALAGRWSEDDDRILDQIARERKRDDRPVSRQISTPATVHLVDPVR